MDRYKSLGIDLQAGHHYLLAHERKAKSRRNKSIATARALWGYSRCEVTRVVWKMVAVPGLTFGNAVLCLPSGTRQYLEVRQREVGRSALGASRTAPNEAVQGDMGWSSFEAREARAKLGFERRLSWMSDAGPDKFSSMCIFGASRVPTRWVRRMRQLAQRSLIFSPLKRRELWRFLSYALVHDGLLHMGSNVILQLAFGLPLEVVHSWWRVMIVYCSGVQCGPLAQSFFNPHVYLAGSSSGVYALQTAHLAHIVTNFRDMEFVWIRLLGLLFIYGNDLYWVLTGPQRRQGRYFSYAGHYGGALAGLLGSISPQSGASGGTNRFRS
ncbi:hypothetical protein HPB47_027380 [Ixodes persulcatus]|uniref:Uncharacterized protein n=1 Tax=Ixodes persulcatus TaxID=34615 RepID=A0AC60PY35_IXOPE|nr:hypothetical protein HPB47_027380 [Ixodes persulcatus]